ncbi:MAG: hypothetical protein HRU50_05065 [Winogradskyella sp.]|uniref:hypothetical protein n=1 Tax=Winogradskyella sp. TaxID=1883156 RepID=UPI0025FF5464|nr:hypothetical protein [Winogradskyella sp.]NRB59298.1 hypothetical protein [Winogradskyella sp.]
MSLVSLNKNTIALIVVSIIAIAFFVCGMLDILDYVIVKALLFLGIATISIIAFVSGINNATKNRSKD